MSDTLIFGLLGTFIPLFAVGYFMLKKNAGVFRMYVAMLLVGLGYLTATGAIEDIGARFLGRDSAAVVVPAGAPASAPAAEKAAEPAPVPAAEAPKADAAPAAPAEAPKADAAPAPAEEKPAEAPKP